MKKIMKAAVIMHNMIVETRRCNYGSDGTAGLSSFFNEGDESNDIEFVSKAPCSMFLSHMSSVSVADDIKVKGLYRDLLSNLIEHHWKNFGGSSAER